MWHSPHPCMMNVGLLDMFVDALTPSLTPSLTHSLTHSLTRSLICWCTMVCSSLIAWCRQWCSDQCDAAGLLHIHSAGLHAPERSLRGQLHHGGAATEGRYSFCLQWHLPSCLTACGCQPQVTFRLLGLVFFQQCCRAVLIRYTFVIWFIYIFIIHM